MNREPQLFCKIQKKVQLLTTTKGGLLETGKETCDPLLGQRLLSPAALLLSLNYFNPEFMSLLKPRPLILTAGTSPYEVTKARVKTLFLSGRYCTEQL